MIRRLAVLFLIVGGLAGTAAAEEPTIVIDLPTNPKLVVGQPDGEDAPDYRITIADEPDIKRDDPDDLGYWKWWLFRVDGAKGRTLTFEVHNPINGQKWATLNPVYMNGGELDELDSFASQRPDEPAGLGEAPNGAKLPDTTGQRWQFIEQAGSVGREKKTLRFTHRFTDDRVWVAMRYPCTPGYLEAWYKDVEQRAGKNESLKTKLYTIGRSEDGKHRLRILTIGEQREYEARPTLLIYAREHAQDQDASFVVQGAAEYLMSDDPRAARLRDLYTFIFIPMLDPQGAMAGQHDRIRSDFHGGQVNGPHEATLYENWLKQWLKDEQRVDLVINLHNYESTEGPHLQCWQWEAEHTRGRLGKLMEMAVWEQATDAGYSVARPHGYTSVAHSRFGGMVRREANAVLTSWMVNAQAERHLTLAEVRDLGRQYIIGATNAMRTRELPFIIEIKLKR